MSGCSHMVKLTREARVLVNLQYTVDMSKDDTATKGIYTLTISGYDMELSELAFLSTATIQILANITHLNWKEEGSFLLFIKMNFYHDVCLRTCNI